MTEFRTATDTDRRGKKQAPSRAEKSSEGKRDKLPFTHRQGQFLAFIHSYRLLHRRGPSEVDFVQFFRVTPPSAHDMIVRLEKGATRIGAWDFLRISILVVDDRTRRVNSGIKAILVSDFAFARIARA